MWSNYIYSTIQDEVNRHFNYQSILVALLTCIEKFPPASRTTQCISLMGLLPAFRPTQDAMTSLPACSWLPLATISVVTPHPMRKLSHTRKNNGCDDIAVFVDHLDRPWNCPSAARAVIANVSSCALVEILFLNHSYSRYHRHPTVPSWSMPIMSRTCWIQI